MEVHKKKVYVLQVLKRSTWSCSATRNVKKRWLRRRRPGRTWTRDAQRGAPSRGCDTSRTARFWCPAPQRILHTHNLHLLPLQSPRCTRSTCLHRSLPRRSPSPTVCSLRSLPLRPPTTRAPQPSKRLANRSRRRRRPRRSRSLRRRRSPPLAALLRSVRRERRRHQRRTCFRCPSQRPVLRASRASAPSRATHQTNSDCQRSSPGCRTSFFRRRTSPPSSGKVLFLFSPFLLPFLFFVTIFFISLLL